MDRALNFITGKRIGFIFGAIGLFWLFFAVVYPYQLLIDDTRYELILVHGLYPFGDKFTRWIHHGLLMLEGSVFHWKMSSAVYLSYALHCGIVALGLFKLLPRIPSERRLLTLAGLCVFAVHPVSLQTAVHIAQRSEILGAFFLMLYLVEAFGARPRLWLLFLFSVGALFSKEPYAVVGFAHLAALGLARSGRARWLGVAAIPVLILGAYVNSFSLPSIQNDTNYARSRAYRTAVQENRIISDELSTYLPIRDRRENLWLQTALIPKVLEATILPFRTVRDYGQFPYGRATYRADLPYFWLGLGFSIALAGVLLWLLASRRLSLVTVALIYSPIIFYSSYWVFPVYDPLMLYRLYGVVFCFFVLSIPTLTGALRKQPVPFGVAIGIAVFYLVAGSLKFYEMSDPIRQGQAEREYAPTSYRSTVNYVRARLTAKDFPIDCSGLYEPLLTLTPSTALIYIDWAFCHVEQGQMAEAKLYARKSLAQEQVPENVRVATQYLMGPQGFEVPTHEIHPENLKVMLRKE